MCWSVMTFFCRDVVFILLWLAFKISSYVSLVHLSFCPWIAGPSGTAQLCVACFISCTDMHSGMSIAVYIISLHIFVPVISLSLPFSWLSQQPVCCEYMWSRLV